MGPGFFVIAILGCADGGTSCTPVATLDTHYASAESCSAATGAALEASTGYDFPTLLARCRPGAAKATAERGPSRPAASTRG